MFSLPIPLIAILDELCGAIGPVRALERLTAVLPAYAGEAGVDTLAATIANKPAEQAMTDARALLGITEPA